MPRPKGLPKTGGRKKGVQTRNAKLVDAAYKRWGLTPKEYLLRVMRDEKASTERRDWAASTVAPFVHPRLAAIETKVDAYNTVEMRVTRAELAAAAKKRIDEAFREYSPPKTIDHVPPSADVPATLPDPPQEPEPERPPREYAREGPLAAAPEVARLPAHYRRPRPRSEAAGAAKSAQRFH